MNLKSVYIVKLSTLSAATEVSIEFYMTDHGHYLDHDLGFFSLAN